MKHISYEVSTLKKPHELCEHKSVERMVLAHSNKSYLSTFSSLPEGPWSQQSSPTVCGRNAKDYLKVIRVCNKIYLTVVTLAHYRRIFESFT